MKATWMIGILGTMALTACNQGNEQMTERALVEGRASSRGSLEAENANMASRAEAMERDLERRHRFMEAVSGTYEGVTSSVQGQEVPIRILIASGFPRQPTSGRARSIEELSYELTNLHLNVQTVEWSPINEEWEMAFGCVFEQIRPDLVEGSIRLMSEECKISYALFASEPDSKGVDRTLSRGLAADVAGGRLAEIPAFIGSKQSNLSSKKFPIKVQRVAEGLLDR